VRSERVVLLSPILSLFSCISQIREPVLVETIVSEAAVEALDVGVLRRLAWLDEMQG
jgi:hypothetical protein